MDRLSGARTVKCEIENNISVLVPQDKTTSSHLDAQKHAENDMIMSLRQDQNLKWGEIADRLNRQREKAGKPGSFDAATVYSRYVLHTTRVAEPIGEIGFDAKDYAHLRHPTQCIEGAEEVKVSKAGKKRIKNYENARELKANMRQPVGEEAQNELETTENTEQLVQAVAKVERNFWRLVADEMERVTTKMYKPEDLASRYRAI